MKNNDKDDIQVSVLCLAYNHEKYIRETLEGFVNQKTNFKFEVLIHDDASTDQTASIIAEYEELYPELIKPIYQKENQHSQGVKIQQIYNYPRAKGKYFAWCEGDDYWCDKGKLQKQFDVMEEHPECSMCIHKVQAINEDGSLNSQVYPDKHFGMNRDGVLSDDIVAKAVWQTSERFPLQTSSYFVRREALKGFITGTLDFAKFMNGDIAHIRNSLNEGHIYFINQIMSYYRLMSIGSYNYRLTKLTESDIRKIYLREAMGDLLFDEYSLGRFHKWIIRYVSDWVVSSGAYDYLLMDQFLNDTILNKKDVLTNCSLQNKMKYYLSVYMHPLYTLLRKVDDFRNRKK